MTDAARRVLELVGRGCGSSWAWIDGGPQGRSTFGSTPDLELRGDDLALFDEVDAARRRDPDATWIGWITYDVGAAALLGRPARAGGVSGTCMRRYPGTVSFGADGLRGQGDPRAVAATIDALHSVEVSDGNGPGWPLGRLRAPIAPERYRASVRVAKEHIAAGDTYQVNMAQPFMAAWAEAAADMSLSARVAALYGHLRARSPASMGGLVADGERFIVSNSPETLLEWTRDRIASWPIKGTIARRDAAAFGREREALLHSAKDRAEHVMIVDLVRSDLGQIAIAGSVTTAAPQLLSLATVHHLVTEVRARPEPSLSLRRAIEAVFPAGSITGAPKRRTVEIIDALEGAPRGIYCGALVLATADAVTLSVTIRSGIADADGLLVHGGGGITIDSDPEAERLETLAKVRAFRSAGATRTICADHADPEISSKTTFGCKTYL
jgi:anthranilate/para-aminobenzoate synthase component I